MNDAKRNRSGYPHRHGGIAVWSDFCAVAASPDLKTRLKAEVADARQRSGSPLAQVLGIARGPRRLGFDDGVIVPPDRFPVGTPYEAIRRAAAERAPLRGAVRVIVVLVQFSDRAMGETAAHFNDLFFSTGVLPHGSVKEYYSEVTGGLVDITGEVVGPYQLPQTLAWYANGNFGIGRPSGDARANIMAQDAAIAADPQVDFSLYDNDGNGLIDAFIVVHAGRGGEETGNSGDIWSHKWTLPSARNADGKQIFAYLTIPEDARIGVCAHELGHLLFGFPDLYDTDDTSEGIGNWCLMSGGSWNGNGDVPAHPSAWCKVNQGWVTVSNVSTNGNVSIPDVKASRAVHRLWKDGAGGSEYFLVENRQRTGYDADLPGEGLLIWHIDEAQPGNTDENHYKVALMQADGKRDMELDHNRGDSGDPYPGASGNAAFTPTSNPNSNSYANQKTCVSVTNISASGPTMSAKLAVSCAKGAVKDRKDTKESAKEATKEQSKDRKDRKDRKEQQKDVKEATKEVKDSADNKQIIKDYKDQREGKPPKENVERPGGGGGFGGFAPQGDLAGVLADIDARLTMLEASLGSGGDAQPFIGASERPDLVGGPQYADAAQERETPLLDRDSKASLDSPSR